MTCLAWQHVCHGGDWKVMFNRCNLCTFMSAQTRQLDTWPWWCQNEELNQGKVQRSSLMMSVGWMFAIGSLLEIAQMVKVMTSQSDDVGLKLVDHSEWHHCNFARIQTYIITCRNMSKPVQNSMLKTTTSPHSMDYLQNQFHQFLAHNSNFKISRTGPQQLTFLSIRFVVNCCPFVSLFWPISLSFAVLLITIVNSTALV